MSKKLSTAFLVLAGALWGCLSIFVSALSDYGFDSKEIGFIRISLCTLMLLVIILIRDRSLLRVQLRDMWMFVGTGIISVTLFSYCYFTTVINVEAGIAASLLYTSPVFVMLFSAVLFRERITAQKIAAIVLTVSGVALVSGMLGSSALGALDLIIGIGAGLFYSLYSIFGVYALRKYSSLTVTFYTFLLGTIGFLFMTNPIAIIEKTASNPVVIPMEIGLALFNGLLPYLFYTIGLGHTDASVAGVLVAVEPLVGCLVGIFIFHESVNPAKLIGIALILSAIVLLNIRLSHKSTAKEIPA